MKRRLVVEAVVEAGQTGHSGLETGYGLLELVTVVLT